MSDQIKRHTEREAPQPQLPAIVRGSLETRRTRRVQKLSEPGRPPPLTRAKPHRVIGIEYDRIEHHATPATAGSRCARLGVKAKGSLGPVVIWVGVIPGSTSADTAHEVSQEILALLLKNRVEGGVEWREELKRPFEADMRERDPECDK